MKWWKWLLVAVITLLSLSLIAVYTVLRLSMPQYEGSNTGRLSSAARLERDAQGYLTIHAANRQDAAYALGFSHAQERFFQMDILRRNAAGELSALFGERALATDKLRRQHQFRKRAEQSYNALSELEQNTLQAYTRGVNDGLSALNMPPFEYTLLRQSPDTWQHADAFLVIYSMYLDLQAKLGRDDYAMSVLKQAVPAEWFQFLQQDADIWQAALDNSVIANVSLPDTPYPQNLRQQTITCVVCAPKDSTDIGSNNFAVSGKLTRHGGAILADDMHLGSRVPGTWFKAQLNWREQDKLHTVSGLTLPGTPAIVVGSNGHIAWGFTNSTGDWHDLVALKLSDDGKRYLTPQGWQPFNYHYETIKIANQNDQTLELTETIWGPVVRFGDSAPYALRWVGHDDNAVNFKLMQLESATSVADALAIAPGAGIPTQNLVVADSRGNIGWSLMGKLPKRNLSDLDTAQDWSDGKQGWQGYVDATQQPQITDADRLWTANARMIGGSHYQLIGNGGYDLGARGWQIKQGLEQLTQADEHALHQIQLDNRALMLQRWQQLLLDTLTPQLVAEHQLQQYQNFVQNSSERASTDAVGYTLVRAFRQRLLELQFAPMSALLEQHSAQSRDLKYSLETPLWFMLQQRRADTLPLQFSSVDDLLQSAILHSKQQLELQYGSLAAAKWGVLNTAEIKHPLSSAIPLFGDWLNMPASPFQGDSHMPRVQKPAFGQSQRMVVAPGHEESGILTIPTGQSGHPLSPFYRADHQYWLNEVALPFLPGEKKYQLLLSPQG